MNFVVALKAEATPLVDFFELVKENAASPFPIFANDRHRLVLSGGQGTCGQSHELPERTIFKS